jgi:hypothetical protein
MVARTTGRALIDFWQTPFVESRVSSRMAADMATACREVLGAQANANSVDLRICPANELADQFMQAHPDRPRATLAAYKSRFKKAARLYLEYLEDSTDWPKGEPKVVKTKPKVKLQDYQFPLRQDMVIPVGLPLDITGDEARRLGAFIDSLVVGKE